jgi:D-beta-D-heptose 7-phosphate kinase/D-beta-D-heptose 1-phosphate adenosyltransferase
MFHFEDALKLLAGQTVLCVGDLMLDDFVYGEVARISPEAPAPVLAVARSELIVGGSGNVGRNVAGLGARCIVVGVIGDDDAGRILAGKMAGDPRMEPYLIIDRTRPTTRKVRFVSEHHSTHLLRADWEMTAPIAANVEAEVRREALAALPRADSLVLSDYAKGALTPALIRALIDAANAAGKPVIIDPKGKDFSIYKGATLITPNLHELAETTQRRIAGEDDIASAAVDLCAKTGSEAILVTRSEAGMSLVSKSGEAVHIAAYPVKVRDVSGAGDTVAAAAAIMLAIARDFEQAMRVANAAAAVVVGKRGTATLSAAELRARILPAASLAPEEKIVFDWSILDERLAAWRHQGLRIGFTNGCFDLLHPGHIKLLNEAHAACDRLIVGLNSDASVRRLKGEQRPMQKEHARAEVLAALEAVDLVVIFEEDTPLKLISRVRPNVLAKGGDYRLEEVVGHELVEAIGGEVILIDVVPGVSTSDIVRRSQAAAE